MRPDGVIVMSPLFDEHFSLTERVEDFPIQKFIPELAVKAFVVAVLLGAAGLNVERSDIEPVARYGPHWP